MNILSVASEVFPLVKTGGLGDVTGSLPGALKRLGIRTRTVLPGYPNVMAQIAATPDANPWEVAWLDLFGHRAAILSTHLSGLDLLVVNAPSLYDRPGGPYLDADGHDHADNAKRFAALSFAAAEIATGVIEGFAPDLVHTHDWQTALTSVYLKYVKASRIPSVLTIHNLAFQGKFSFAEINDLGLPDAARSIDCLEYYGDVSFLKGGITTADAVTTVSPTYAREILGAGLGMGMDGVLRQKRHVLTGIVNGIDPDIWNPATDPHIVSRYDARTIDRRRINRKNLINQFGLADGSGPIFSVVSRLSWQKGIDLLCDVAPHLVAAGGRLIFCGKGDSGIERRIRDLVDSLPGHVAAIIGYDEATAHMIHAGTDFIVQPSRFEPCGLTQLYALRYGAVPVVSRTGGLAETIVDANDAAMGREVATGIQFHPVTGEQLRHAIDRAMAVFAEQHAFRQLQIQGMTTDFSWETSAAHYADLYREVTSTPPDADDQSENTIEARKI